MRRLINAGVITRSEKFGLGMDIWYSIDYRDRNEVARNTIQYGKDIEDACRKIDINWLK